MRALTLYQPWASLIADGRKTIETRPRPLSYRGPIAIHAGLKIDIEAARRWYATPELMPRGQVIAVANMVDCVQFPHPQTPPDAFGDFTAGRYGYILENILRIVPVPARGYQCLWDWKDTPVYLI